jgi:hypothetical protein
LIVFIQYISKLPHIHNTEKTSKEILVLHDVEISMLAMVDLMLWERGIVPLVAATH